MGVSAGADMVQGGGLSLKDLSGLLAYCRLFPFLVVARPPLVGAAPAHDALPSPVERAARAAALLTSGLPRAGALVALNTAYGTGETRAAPA